MPSHARGSSPRSPVRDFFFFNDTATTEIYTLSLHDALPISTSRARPADRAADERGEGHDDGDEDRKSTRLNSSHQIISYAVFCLKKKNSSNLRCFISDAACEPWQLETCLFRLLLCAVCVSIA